MNTDLQKHYQELMQSRSDRDPKQHTQDFLNNHEQMNQLGKGMSKEKCEEMDENFRDKVSLSYDKIHIECNSSAPPSSPSISSIVTGDGKPSNSMIQSPHRSSQSTSAELLAFGQLEELQIKLDLQKHELGK